jgi:ABC-type branched-subunit amino acid transport system substrate-binding protein
MSDCLHCDINQLVQERMDKGDVDLEDLTAMIAEALADWILMAPEIDQAKLLADAMAQLGQMYLEKSGAIDGDPSRATH